MTRHRLLDAALYTFNSRGVDGCSIEDITQSADLGKGTFYRHFMDKLDILKTLLDLAIDELIRRMPDLNIPALSVEDRASQLLAAHMTFFSERTDLFKVFLQAQAMVASRAAAVPGLQPPFSRYMDELEKRITPALPAPVLPGQSRRLAAAIAAAGCGTVIVGLSIVSNKQDVMNNLDLSRQSLLAGIPQLLRCAG